MTNLPALLPWKHPLTRIDHPPDHDALADAFTISRIAEILGEDEELFWDWQRIWNRRTAACGSTEPKINRPWHSPTVGWTPCESGSRNISAASLPRGPERMLTLKPSGVVRLTAAASPPEATVGLGWRWVPVSPGGSAVVPQGPCLGRPVEPISAADQSALRLSFQSFEIRNDVLTISGVRNGDKHLRAVNVACRVLEPLIEGLLIPRDV